MLAEKMDQCSLRLQPSLAPWSAPYCSITLAGSDLRCIASTRCVWPDAAIIGWPVSGIQVLEPDSRTDESVAAASTTMRPLRQACGLFQPQVPANASCGHLPRVSLLQRPDVFTVAEIYGQRNRKVGLNSLSFFSLRGPYTSWRNRRVTLIISYSSTSTRCCREIAARSIGSRHNRQMPSASASAFSAPPAHHAARLPESPQLARQQWVFPPPSLPGTRSQSLLYARKAEYIRAIVFAGQLAQRASPTQLTIASSFNSRHRRSNEAASGRHRLSALSVPEFAVATNPLPATRAPAACADKTGRHRGQ